MSVSKTSNKKRLMQDGGRASPQWYNRTTSLQNNETMFEHTNVTQPTQVTLQNNITFELPETHQTLHRCLDPGVNSIDLLLQKSLKEKVITEGTEKFKYFCHPCNTEILGISNIRDHLVGKKHANFSFYDVMRNPINAPSVLKDLVPKVVLDATLAQQVICLTPSTFRCGLCQKGLNGVKPLVQHLEFHRCNSMAFLRSGILAASESSGAELHRSTHKSTEKRKVLLLEYAIGSDIGSAPVENLVDYFQQMGFELNYFINLSPTETVENLFKLFNPGNDEEVVSFICVVTGTAYDQTFYNSSREAIKLSDVVNSMEDTSCPRFEEKDKVFIIDMHNISDFNILGKHSSNLMTVNEERYSWLVPKNTTMVIASTTENEDIFVPSLAKNFKENPKLELYEMYLKICDDMDNSVGRVAYQNHQARKFSFL